MLDGQAQPGLEVRHRKHLRPGRPHLLRVSYSDDELDALRAAAERSGLTLTGYVAAAALAAAQGTAVAAPAPAPAAREVLGELILARAQVRRFGSLLNQVAARLNSGKEPPVWLDRAVALGERAVARVDDAAARIGETLP
jgi:uncharacterized protein (DUF1778 family)